MGSRDYTGKGRRARVVVDYWWIHLRPLEKSLYIFLWIPESAMEGSRQIVETELINWLLLLRCVKFTIWKSKRNFYDGGGGEVPRALYLSQSVESYGKKRSYFSASEIIEKFPSWELFVQKKHYLDMYFQIQIKFLHFYFYIKVKV